MQEIVRSISLYSILFHRNCCYIDNLQLGSTCCPAKIERILHSQTVLLQQSLRRRLLRRKLLRDNLGALVLVAAKLEHVHLIWTVNDTHGAAAGVHAGEWGVLADTGTTVGLDSLVNGVEQHLWHKHLGDGNLLERSLGISVVNGNGGVADDQTRGVDVNARLGDALEHDAVFREELLERLLALVVDAGEEVVEGLLGGADGAHGVVDTAGTETALDDLEAAAWAEDDVVEWHADVVESDVAVTVWGIVVAEDAEHTVDGDTWGVVWDEHDRLLLVDIRVVGVVLAHDDVDFAAWVACT